MIKQSSLCGLLMILVTLPACWGKGCSSCTVKEEIVTTPTETVLEVTEPTTETPALEEVTVVNDELATK